MRVFKDYEDYEENKYLGENGVTQYHLDKYYNGNLELAKKDNGSNVNCFNCYKGSNLYDCYESHHCSECNKCYDAIYCYACDNCISCQGCANCCICEFCTNCLLLSNESNRNQQLN